MKKLLFGILSLFLVASLSAQDGKKAYRKATTALGAFYLDQINNKGKLQEAYDAINEALADAEVAAEAKSWVSKGEIYNEISNQMVLARQLGSGNEGLPAVENPAIEAAEALTKAYNMAEKKYEKSDALKALRVTQGNLSNLGIFAYEDQNFDAAYANFDQVIKSHTLMKEGKEASALDVEDDYNNQLYITGLAALNAGKVAEATAYFQQLYDIKYDKPAIYEALYKAKMEGDAANAYTYLEEGRKRYPDDVSLLFAEINHFLRENKLDELIGKIQKAIEKEPDNVSLYSTLGNVYDNLYQKELSAGNEAAAQGHFDNAMKYYNSAIEKDPKYADALYSLGALFYNKAAVMTTQLNKLADDYSKEGIKKYEALKASIFLEFDKALPYFQKAEALAPNDVNTLIALKEIYARKDDLEKSNEFKTRLDNAQNGIENKPYFKN
ncbi:MAG TPA: tetratricopeptide repeat protein [Saprospiraceae bacterium]|nr:tetratricopeptide repeat protein [Saprospiraceae bacterium]HMQ85509.1 tetratricopeptide repeat protein [Saprospiraceae bacterium]